jgi:hypothetical protein
MKPFAKYLAESERTYDYRIKLCGRIPDEQVRDLKSKLDQFDPVKMGEVKVTPIQKILTDFPNNQNDAVTMFDVSFRYPAIEPQIKQLYQLMGGNPNLVVMQTQDYVDGLVDEADRVETENKDLLANTDYPKNNKVQDGLKKDYGVEAHNHVVLQNQYRSDFTVAGGKTPAAKTSNDLPQGTRSPMTNIKRPPKPATGAQPRG